MIESYLRNDIWILLLVLLLAIPAGIRYPRQTFFLYTWLALAGIALFIPIEIAEQGTQTLLDRPFVQMFMVILFSITGGLGLAGLMQWILISFPKGELVWRSIPFIVFGLVILNMVLNYKFYPSECCRFTTRDDLAAFTWIDNNLPSDAKILIASEPLTVNSFETARYPSGVDAGIWITPLLYRRANMAWEGVQFDTDTTYIELCNLDIDYVYVSDMPASFDTSQLISMPSWYAPVFTLPKAGVYQVLGCLE